MGTSCSKDGSGDGGALGARVGDVVEAGGRLDWTMETKDGPLTLSDMLAAGKCVVVFFYPKDETYGCTMEACAFRDRYEAFCKLGAEVVGVSNDKDHTAFAKNHRLTYPLASDVGGQVRRQWGLTQFDVLGGLIKGRATYVIAPSGRIEQVFNSAIDFEGHMKESLDTVERIMAQSQGETVEA